MKKKQLIISLSLAVTVLFSILFQSLHTYEHFIKQFSSTECHHKYSHGEPEITHQHHNFDDCKVCHFTFGSYVSPEVFAYSLQTNYKQTPYFFEKGKIFISFPGSLYSLRGPPSVIV
jgi:hypothetical protein